MLALSRRKGEEIVIGGSIRVAILRIEGGQVRVGVSAPEDVPIVRSELLDGDQPASVEGGPEPDGESPATELAESIERLESRQALREFFARRGRSAGAAAS